MLVTALLLLGLALAVLSMLSGCDDTSTRPPPPVIGTGEARAITDPVKGKDEAVLAGADRVEEGNQANPNPPSKAAIAEGVADIREAVAAAPAAATVKQVQDVVDRYNDLVGAFGKLQKDFADYRIEADKEARMLVVKALAALGSLITLAGVGVLLWTSYKIAGGATILCGLLIAAAGPFFTRPWVWGLLILAALLAGLAVGLKHAWVHIDRNGNGRPDFLEKKP
jgi:hypothetical protein